MSIFFLDIAKRRHEIAIGQQPNSAIERNRSRGMGWSPNPPMIK
jgi:hypothetical protein